MAETAKGAVAGGHTLTVAAAADVLREGGNAFDAAVAGLWMACVCEPVLASPGGGGFALAKPHGGEEPIVYDFFVQTPRAKREPEEIEFNSVFADFGTATQEFHIGHGASAVPGYVPGLHAIREELGTMPMARLLAPAIETATSGVEVTPFQAFLAHVVAPILSATPSSRALHAPGGRLLDAGEIFSNPGLGHFLAALAEGGLGYYRNEAVPVFVHAQSQCGQLVRGDFSGYAVERRQPLSIRFAGAHIHLNPPPSTGGAFAAHALAQLGACDAAAVPALAAALDEAEAARRRYRGDANAMLDGLGLQRTRTRSGGSASRGTTHVSVIDASGNACSATVSNGEGNGHIADGFGFMLNNMLGEEDLNPGGFHSWGEAARLASNMCPVVAERADGSLIALGSGGSNRIRSAVFQVLARVLGAHEHIVDAVAAPRLHLEDGQLDFEDMIDAGERAELVARFPKHRAWSEQNLFFGGCHAAGFGADGFEAAGDRRRGGHFAIVT